MRKSGVRLNVFAPVEDLSAISKGETAPQIAGGRVLGDEWTEYVVKVSYNTLVLIDITSKFCLILEPEWDYSARRVSPIKTQYVHDRLIDCYISSECFSNQICGGLKSTMLVPKVSAALSTSEIFLARISMPLASLMKRLLKRLSAA